LGGHEGDAVEPALKPYFRFGADGSFVGHFSSKASTLLGLVRLARCLAQRGRTAEAGRYLHEARKSYDWILAAGNPGRGSRIGWLPETAGTDFHEMCCAADTIELAEALAQCAALGDPFRDWCRLYDDVESMAVNLVACSQVRFSAELERLLAGRYGAQADQQLKTARRFDGVYVAIVQDLDAMWHQVSKPISLDRRFLALYGCCQYSGVQALRAGWRGAMTAEGGRLAIQYFLNRQSPQAVMATKMPVEGEAEIVLRQPAEVLIRVPGWLKPEQLALSVGGDKIEAAGSLDSSRHYVALGTLAAGTQIQVRFPLEERRTVEPFAQREHTICWKGNYVVQCSHGDAEIPIFREPFGR
jgi:hypothetical protein